jgi:LysR family transcriptional regulator, glycine cleavage system transcriptional activator
MSKLPLRSIEAFVVTARTLSLAKAAVILNLTVPAVSRRIQLLERDLGTLLFQRLPRGLSLTDAGEKYFAALGPSWEIVCNATEAARVTARRRSIKVSVMPTFAANWLVPRLIRFHARHAQTEIELETSSDVVDLEARPDLDCAIRLGRGPWNGLHTQRLLAVDAYPVASPEYLANKRPLRAPTDLQNHTLIGSHHQPDFWPEWFGGAAVADSGQRNYRNFDNLQLVYEAAAAKLGIAIGLDPVVRPYLASGRLVRVGQTDVRLSRSFHLVRRLPDRTSGGALQIFRDWLFREASASGSAGPVAIS